MPELPPQQVQVISLPEASEQYVQVVVGRLTIVIKAGARALEADTYATEDLVKYEGEVERYANDKNKGDFESIDCMYTNYAAGDPIERENESID